MSQPLRQRRLHCPCGRAKILARGLCAVCYTLRRQDRVHFGGLREQVLARDQHRCRVCLAPGRGRQKLAVHHRRPGVSTLATLITLCPACHAKVSRTQLLLKEWPQLLTTLWREQHPKSHEQGRLVFGEHHKAARSWDLFDGDAFLHEDEGMQIPGMRRIIGAKPEAS